MKTDLVLAPFDASAGDLLAAAHAAGAGGFDAVWIYDHFSGLVTGTRWSRDPFVTLGAIAATTQRINLGVLVANTANRHPAQLACAVNTLQSLAPGRILLGVGAGTSTRSQWSSEAKAIGRAVPGSSTRRAVLAETIGALRAIWRGEAFAGEHFQAAEAMAVTDGTSIPPIVVGASSHETIEVACEHADGVNLLPEGGDISDRVAFARERAVATPFEVSAFVPFDVDHPLGGDPEPLAALGVDRRTLWVAAPYPVERIRSVAAALSSR